MSESDGYGGSFVPVDAGALEALEDAAQDLAGSKVALDRATQALLELCEDMRAEAVRRLGERGASSAQVERYEEGYRTTADEVKARAKALDAACARLREALRTARL